VKLDRTIAPHRRKVVWWVPQRGRPAGLERMLSPIVQVGLFKQSADGETAHPVERLG